MLWYGLSYSLSVKWTWKAGTYTQIAIIIYRNFHKSSKSTWSHSGPCRRQQCSVISLARLPITNWPFNWNSKPNVYIPTSRIAWIIKYSSSVVHNWTCFFFTIITYLPFRGTWNVLHKYVSSPSNFHSTLNIYYHTACLCSAVVPLYFHTEEQITLPGLFNKYRGCLSVFIFLSTVKYINRHDDSVMLCIKNKTKSRKGNFHTF